MLVVVGCVASFIVMFVPPKSARKAVRVRNATAITGLSNIYLSLTSNWIGKCSPFTQDNVSEQTTGSNREDGSAEEAIERADSIRHLRPQLTAVATQLLSLNDVVESARWEAYVLGEWPYHEYKTMLEIEQDMVAILALVRILNAFS